MTRIPLLALLALLSLPAASADPYVVVCVFDPLGAPSEMCAGDADASVQVTPFSCITTHTGHPFSGCNGYNHPNSLFGACVTVPTTLGSECGAARDSDASVRLQGLCVTTNTGHLTSGC